VSQGIHRLTQGVTNFYLIEESGKYTLVDAGTPADWAFFARSIAGLGGHSDPSIGWRGAILRITGHSGLAGLSGGGGATVTYAMVVTTCAFYLAF
jgi:hypothetical protein